MKLVLFLLLALLVGGVIGYRLGNGGVNRTNDVQAWAEAAFDDGVISASFPEDVRLHNRAFSVSSVVLAHKGAWH